MVRKMTSHNRGDTLVEVLMAVVIISVVIVGAITMMNRGLAAGQVALEHSQVRLAINSQIEMLQFARNEYIRNTSSPSAVQWKAIVTASDQQPVNYDQTCNVSGTKTGFYLTKSGTQVTRNTYTPNIPGNIPTAGTGIWIESVLSPNGLAQAYVDFIIRACWQASGNAANQQRSVTAVRLYDPSR